MGCTSLLDTKVPRAGLRDLTFLTLLPPICHLISFLIQSSYSTSTCDNKLVYSFYAG
jgi:hypothetical protein